MKILNTGEVVYVHKMGIIEHWGIVTHDGDIISASKKLGKVVKQTLHEFCEGDTSKVRSKGYLVKGVSINDVLYKAYSMLGKPYDLLKHNCQHFVNSCYGLKGSPQLNIAIGFSILILFFYMKK